MKGSYLNDEFFSRLETLSLELRADLAGFFGGKHLVQGEHIRAGSTQGQEQKDEKQKESFHK